MFLQAIYDEYTMRARKENCNKELKTVLPADLLKTIASMANFFRLYLHTAVLNLLVRLRQTVVQLIPTSRPS